MFRLSYKKIGDDSAGYLAICAFIEYAKTRPKLLRLEWCGSCGRGSPDPDNNNDDAIDQHQDEDEDVAFEAERVEIMAAAAEETPARGVLRSGKRAEEEEVVLRRLRKVYKTKQARASEQSLGGGGGAVAPRGGFLSIPGQQCTLLFVGVFHMCVCVYRLIKFQMTAQSGPVILVILGYSRWSSQGG